MAEASDTTQYGEVTYHLMARYWLATAEQTGATKHDINYARGLNNAQKLSFFKTLRTTGWSNTRIIHDNIAQEISELKELPGKNLLMLVATTLTWSFIQLGPIDEC